MDIGCAPLECGGLLDQYLVLGTRYRQDNIVRQSHHCVVWHVAALLSPLVIMLAAAADVADEMSDAGCERLGLRNVVTCMHESGWISPLPLSPSIDGKC